jgi:hypothetical protein
MSYKVVFRGHQPDKHKFKDSDCVLSISVGQEAHEGEKFAATIDFVNANFRSCTIAVCDTLQRHTMALKTEHDANFFHEQSRQEGDLWLARNKKYYDQLHTLNDIVRWDIWLKDPRYFHEKNKITQRMENDREYYRSFEDTTEQFLTRLHYRLKTHTAFSAEKDLQLCFDYLIEECVVLNFWPDLNCHFWAYPNEFIPPIIETHDRFISPFHPNTLHLITLQLKETRELQPLTIAREIIE